MDDVVPRPAGAALAHPQIEQGAHTIAFIEACVASQQHGARVDVAKLPTR